MQIPSITIENHNRFGKISSYRFHDITSRELGVNIISIEIRKNGSYDYEKIYEKMTTKHYYEQSEFINQKDIETVNTLKPLAEEEINEISTFISYDKEGMRIFNEYLIEYKKSQTIDKTTKQEERLPLKELAKKEIMIVNPNNDLVKNFYYKQITTERYISIKTDDTLQPIYMCTYIIDGDLLDIETEMRKKIPDEQIESIKSFIYSDEDAVNIFDEYLSKIQNKTR